MFVVNPTKVDEYIFWAPVVYIGDSFYVVGGRADGGYITTIGKLDANSRWSKAGDLSTARSGHGAIFDGEYLIVVGGSKRGSDPLKTEKCEFGDDGITCTEQSPLLYRYNYYPELFLVEKDFCKNLPCN